MGLSSRLMAKKYLQEQLRIMKKYGNAPKLSATRTEELLGDIQASFEALKSPKESKEIKTQLTS